MTKFSIGRRWRLKRGIVQERTQEGKSHPDFDFVIVGPPAYGDPKTHKLCRLEYAGHTQPCSGYCSHGSEQTYSHAHLKRNADLRDSP